jgi:hypothetical protein
VRGFAYVRELPRIYRSPVRTPKTVDINGAADLMKIHQGRVHYIQQQIINQTAAKLAIAGRRIRTPNQRPRRTKRGPPTLANAVAALEIPSGHCLRSFGGLCRCDGV